MIHRDSMSIRELVRPNIRKLVPYRCARDDYKVGILLDANENTHGVAVADLSQAEHALELNRYPDPHQIDVKQLLCDMRNKEAKENDFPQTIRPENIYLGVGSDEIIDSLLRALCVPGKDKLLICPPTYGMYTVSADINDVEIVKTPLDKEFNLDLDAVLESLKDPAIKLFYICSPGNPTGKKIPIEVILKVLNAWEGGVVAVDEAYIDFSGPSSAPLVVDHERLVVLQTLSKSFGLAGLRCGMCFAHKEFASILNAMKAPYNISSTTSEITRRALQPESVALMESVVAKIKSERSRLVEELPKIPGVGKIIGGLDANFVLVQILDQPGGKPDNAKAVQVYEGLAQGRQVVVRFRGKEINCEGCLRISIGTREENDRVLQELKDILKV